MPPKKDAVLNIRINSRDLDSIKQKAKQMGIPYQTFVSELIHQYAAGRNEEVESTSAYGSSWRYHS